MMPSIQPWRFRLAASSVTVASLRLPFAAPYFPFLMNIRIVVVEDDPGTSTIITSA